MFILAQTLGGIALIILVISFQKDERKTLLKYQIFSSIFFALQYLCLNAITGCLMNIMTAIRNYVFRRYKEKVPIMYLIAVLLIMILLSIISFNGIISLLPTIAVMLYSIAIWYGNLRLIRIVEVISCSLFIFYNIKVLAIVGLISTLIELASALVAIYKFDIRNIKK